MNKRKQLHEIWWGRKWIRGRNYTEYDEEGIEEEEETTRNMRGSRLMREKVQGIWEEENEPERRRLQGIWE